MSQSSKLPPIYIYQLTVLLSLFTYFIISSFFTLLSPFVLCNALLLIMEWIVSMDRHISYVFTPL